MRPWLVKLRRDLPTVILFLLAACLFGYTLHGYLFSSPYVPWEKYFGGLGVVFVVALGLYLHLDRKITDNFATLDGKITELLSRGDSPK